MITPDINISGTGITGYTILCSASPSCDTQIMATVTIDASTPGGMVETITVTSNGLNPSGFLPVPVEGQSGEATAQAVTLALIASRPYIVLGSGGGACAGSDISGTTPRTVQVGQQITVTGCLPAGISTSNVSSMAWTPTTPHGTAVGGYTAINSGASSSGTVMPLSSPSCTTTQWYCSFPAFYWVDKANGRQFTFRYTLTNGSSNEATVTFDVGGPAGVSVTPTPSPAGVTVVYPPAYFGDVPIPVPIMIFGAPGVRGMNFYATATNLAGGAYRWVQLVHHDRITILGSPGKTGPTDRITGQPAVDKAYPYGYDQQGTPIGTVTTTTVLNDTAQDSPALNLIPTWGEEGRWFQATMYLMWVPAADPNCMNGTSCTIPVPQGKVEWGPHRDSLTRHSALACNS